MPSYDLELSKPHRDLVTILQENYYTVLSEFEVYPNKLDIYLPDYHVGIEVDGPQHGVKREQRRDEFILKTYGIPILRVKVSVVKDSETLLKIAEFCEEQQYSLRERLRIFKDVINKTTKR